jgi:hypothetical protein
MHVGSPGLQGPNLIQRSISPVLAGVTGRPGRMLADIVGQDLKGCCFVFRRVTGYPGECVDPA